MSHVTTSHTSATIPPATAGNCYPCEILMLRTIGRFSNCFWPCMPSRYLDVLPVILATARCGSEYIGSMLWVRPSLTHCAIIRTLCGTDGGVLVPCGWMITTNSGCVCTTNPTIHCKAAPNELLVVTRTAILTGQSPNALRAGSSANVKSNTAHIVGTPMPSTVVAPRSHPASSTSATAATAEARAPTIGPRSSPCRDDPTTWKPSLWFADGRPPSHRHGPVHTNTAFHGKRCGSNGNVPAATNNSMGHGRRLPCPRLCVHPSTDVPATASDAASATAEATIPATAALALHFGLAQNNTGSAAANAIGYWVAAGCTGTTRYGLVVRGGNGGGRGWILQWVGGGKGGGHGRAFQGWFGVGQDVYRDRCRPAVGGGHGGDRDRCPPGVGGGIRGDRDRFLTVVGLSGDRRRRCRQSCGGGLNFLSGDGDNVVRIPPATAPATAVYLLGNAPVAASAAPATAVRVFDGGSSKSHTPRPSVTCVAGCHSPPPRLMPPWDMAPWRASTVEIMLGSTFLSYNDAAIRLINYNQLGNSKLQLCYLITIGLLNQLHCAVVNDVIN